MKKLNLLIALVIFCGCAITQKATVPVSEEGINFKKYETLSIKVEDKVKTEFSKSGTQTFKELLEVRLGSIVPYTKQGFFGEKMEKGLGFKLVEENGDLTISIVIPYFKPDNKALRIIVGFGAGKGGLQYVATFTDSTGKEIATLDGGQSYGDVVAMLPFGDMESTIYRGQDSTKMFMIIKSVEQIADFIRSGGKKYTEEDKATLGGK